MKKPVFTAITLLHLFFVNTSSQIPELPNNADSLSKYSLDAVTIMGVRPFDATSEEASLGSMERMSHDAGLILTHIPSISGIRKGGGYGFDPVLRGFKYSQLGVLVDGIQATTVACPNRMDPPTSQVTLNALSSVEVYKGPYSLRYGNHIGGVLNFVTSEPVFTAKKRIYSRISGGYETNGSILRSEAQVGIQKERSLLELSGSWHKGTDYLDGNKNIVQSAFRRSNLGISGAYKLNAYQQIQGSITRNFARDADYPALPMDLRSDDTWMARIGHSAMLGKDNRSSWKTSIYFSHVDHLMDNLEKNQDPRMLNASTSVLTTNFGGRSELFLPGQMQDIRTGIDFKLENADGYRSREFLMGPNAGNTISDNVWQNGRIKKTGIFAELERRQYPMRYHLSGRLNLNQADALDPDVSFTSVYEDVQSTQINPGIIGGIEYLGKKISAALWAGRVQRSGDLSERYMNSFPVGLDPYELLGNPELLPEVNNQADLVIEISGNHGSKIELDLFFSYLQNFISSEIREDLLPKMPSAPGVRQYTNLEKASIAGFEISFTQKLPGNMHLKSDLAATRGTDLVSGDPLPEIPPLDIRVAFSGKYFQDKLQPRAQLRYVTKQLRISEVFGETTTPSFLLVDMDLSYFLFDRALLSTGVRNIFDVAYYEHLNRSVRGSGNPIYDPGRNIYLGLTIRFG